VETVKKIRYKKAAGDDIDKWTQMTDAYSEMVGGTDGVSTGTYGLGIELYMKSKDSDAVVGFITYTYPDSPAEKAGLKRGDVILEVDGQEMNKANYYQALFASTSLQVGVGTYEGNNVYSAVKKTVSMQSKAMYEDPILLTKVFDCGGKKVGYLAYTSFTFESSLGLYNVCKEFKSQGITELILDLRYNGGGYVFTESVFASMLAPEAEVKKGSVFQTEVWNDEYMAYFKKQGDDLNTYFKTKHVASHADK
jgi:C-terminal processing protease CtpA/Prc